MMVVVCKGMFCGGENVDSGEEMEEEEEVVDGVIGEKYVYCGVLWGKINWEEAGLMMIDSEEMGVAGAVR